ncbi:hypothetical protein IMZ48_37895, partial [Candidatus Bathyarchaeota archaeon]|nr:hypothetical protein [Candidatus Bathyarchaeota archaeon]
MQRDAPVRNSMDAFCKTDEAKDAKFDASCGRAQPASGKDKVKYIPEGGMPAPKRGNPAKRDESEYDKAVRMQNDPEWIKRICKSIKDDPIA